MFRDLSARAIPLVGAVVAGALLPAQFATNGALADILGSTTLTGAVSYFVGAALLAVLITAGRQRAAWHAASTAPPWAWLGGVAGSAYVLGSVFATQRLGAAMTTTVIIAAQVLTAIVIDHFALFGIPQRRMNPLRAVALLLVLAALGLRLGEGA